MPFTIEFDKEELYGAHHNPKELKNLDTPLIAILTM